MAVALHEILAVLIPGSAPHRTPQEVTVSQVSVTRVTPLPKPAPTPRRPAIAHAPTIAAVKPRVVPGPPALSARDAAARSGATRPKPPQLSHAKPVWAVPEGIQGSAGGNAAGSGSADSGAGNGSGAGAAQPCGYVEFSDPNGSRYDPKSGGYWVDVAMTVHFSDGRTQSLLLDYAWFYANAAANPWAQQNLDDPNFPTRFQSPPPAQRAGEPALVQYVIAHSTGDGLTLLKSCP